MISYKNSNNIEIDDLMERYLDAGWLAYTNKPDVLAKAIQKSLFVYSAWEDSKLVGLIRCVGDGQTITYIQDILVRESHKRKGIASHLMKHTLDHFKDVRQIVLVTDNSEASNAFYKSMKFLELKQTGGNCYIIYNQ